MLKLYHRIKSIYKDYRSHIPVFASAALAFYMILLLVPILTLFALGISFLDLELSLYEKLLRYYISLDYVDIILGILYSNNINTIAIFTIVITLFTVSKGVGNIYRISKNMFDEDEDEHLIDYYLYSLRVTILIFVLFLCFIAVMAMKPLAVLFESLYTIVGIRHIILYAILVYFLTVIYKFVPRVKINYKDALIGAMISGALLLALYYGIGLYFNLTDFNSIYGPLSSIVALLFVFHWSAEVFFIGMYSTYKYYTRRLVG